MTNKKRLELIRKALGYLEKVDIEVLYNDKKTRLYCAISDLKTVITMIEKEICPHCEGDV